MNYLHFGAPAKIITALLALTAIPLVSLCLTHPLLSLAHQKAQVSTARARTRHIFQVATLPALAAIPLIIPFRVPRNFVEVVMVPAAVTVIGVAWIQAGAWRISRANPMASLGAVSIAYPLGAALILLLVFQLLLKPGVHFY